MLTPTQEPPEQPVPAGAGTGKPAPPTGRRRGSANTSWPGTRPAGLRFAAQGDFARLAILLIYTHPQAAHILADKIVKGRKRITAYIQKRQQEGYFCQNIDANLFVQVIAMLFAMHAIGRGLNDLLPFANLSREEIIDQLVSLLLYGMVRRDQSDADEIAVS